MLHSVQTTIGNPDRSLFHYGLVKIIIQHQLSLNFKSWDEFLIECQLGPTQYWPNPPPNTRRKWKATVKSKVGNVHEAESKDKELQEANPPINTGISDDGVGNVAPCYSEITLNQSPSDKRCNTLAKTGDKLTKTEDVNAVDYKSLYELNTPRKHGDESMHKLEQLAQVCCDRGGSE